MACIGIPKDHERALHKFDSYPVVAERTRLGT
jgi:hypothetical protein